MPRIPFEAHLLQRPYTNEAIIAVRNGRSTFLLACTAESLARFMRRAPRWDKVPERDKQPAEHKAAIETLGRIVATRHGSGPVEIHRQGLPLCFVADERNEHHDGDAWALVRVGASDLVTQYSSENPPARCDLGILIAALDRAARAVGPLTSEAGQSAGALFGAMLRVLRGLGSELDFATAGALECARALCSVLHGHQGGSVDTAHILGTLRIKPEAKP